MAQLLYFLPYIAGFVLGLNGDPYFWVLGLALVSTPLYILMRWEGHRLFDIPIEDWSPASMTFMLLGQMVLMSLLYGTARVIVLLLRVVGLA